MGKTVGRDGVAQGAVCATEGQGIAKWQKKAREMWRMRLDSPCGENQGRGAVSVGQSRIRALQQDLEGGHRQIMAGCEHQGALVVILVEMAVQIVDMGSQANDRVDISTFDGGEKVSDEVFFAIGHGNVDGGSVEDLACVANGRSIV